MDGFDFFGTPGSIDQISRSDQGKFGVRSENSPKASRLAPLNLPVPTTLSSTREDRLLFPLRSHSDGRGEGQGEVRVSPSLDVGCWMLDVRCWMFDVSRFMGRRPLVFVLNSPPHEPRSADLRVCGFTEPPGSVSPTVQGLKARFFSEKSHPGPPYSGEEGS